MLRHKYNVRYMCALPVQSSFTALCYITVQFMPIYRIPLASYLWKYFAASVDSIFSDAMDYYLCVISGRT